MQSKNFLSAFGVRLTKIKKVTNQKVRHPNHRLPGTLPNHIFIEYFALAPKACVKPPLYCFKKNTLLKKAIEKLKQLQFERESAHETWV